jgi:hypothetical protein
MDYKIDRPHKQIRNQLTGFTTDKLWGRFEAKVKGKLDDILWNEIERKLLYQHWNQFRLQLRVQLEIQLKKDLA